MGLFGMNAFKVTAEIMSSRGQPSFDIVGLGDLAVQESRMRIKGASFGYRHLRSAVSASTVNLSSGGCTQMRLAVRLHDNRRHSCGKQYNNR